MKKNLRTLIVEDSEDDAQLLLLELRRNGYEATHRRVDSAQALSEALNEQEWDIIFADYTMPGFSGTAALSLVRDRRLDVPFIFVSGTIGEDTAVMAMKAGAQDYIMKGNLKRLSPAVERELRDAWIRREQRRADEEMDLLQMITRTASNAGDVNSAIGVTLEMIHEITGWAMAQIWIPNLAGTRIECGSVWRCFDKSLEVFRGASMNLSFSPGEDLPGRVWLSGRGMWIKDVSGNPDFQRANLGDAAAANIAAAAVPILAGSEVVAVIEFFTRIPQQGDERSVKFISAVAAQLGSIVQRKRAEERLQYLAYHDVLTGLPNRALFLDRLEQVVGEAGRQERLVGVLFINIDRFKAINDSLGREVGDRFLRVVAERVCGCIKKGDTVARLGGDEFTLILADMRHAEYPARVAQKILEGMSRPFHLDGHDLYSSVSIGITVYPFDENDVDSLLRDANFAMYRAKERGGNTYEFYSAEMAFKVQTRLALEGDLRHAVDREEFEVHYQPVVDLDSGHMSGFEALIRWRRPGTGKLVSPAEFIPMAEEGGFIGGIGEWIICTACRHFQENIIKLDPDKTLSINVSPRQFANGQILEVVTGVLEQTGFAPSRLYIEITETLLMENPGIALGIMRKMGELGIRFSIDDFGTGYSSLSYLKHLPIDQVKIDKSFMRGVPVNDKDAAMVIGIISMAHSMGLKVVAEGVETPEQVEFLRRHGCDAIQGYYFSPPVPLDNIVSYLSENRTLPR